jgi:hypothetical protein
MDARPRSPIGSNPSAEVLYRAAPILIQGCLQQFEVVHTALAVNGTACGPICQIATLQCLKSRGRPV